MSKIFYLGTSFTTKHLHWAIPPMQKLCVEVTNMLVSKNVKICLTPHAKPKICVTPKANPCPNSVEYRLHRVLALALVLGRYISCCFMSISFALGSQRKRGFQWNMGFRDLRLNIKSLIMSRNTLFRYLIISAVTPQPSLVG